MGLEAIDREQGLALGQRDGFCRGQADDDAANQSRTCRRSNPIERLERNLRLAHRFGDDAIKRFDVGAGGDLGDDAAEAGVEVALAGHDRRPEVGTVLHHADRRLVARRLDPEDVHSGWSSTSVVPGTPSSMAVRSRAYSSPATSSAHMTRASSFVSA